MRRSKPTKIKVWPELTGYLPTISMLRNAESPENGSRAVVEIDFGQVRKVSSTGLTVFLLRLLRLLQNGQVPHIRSDGIPEIRQELERLGAFRLISSMAKDTQHELPLSGGHTEFDSLVREGSVNFPVHRLSFDGQVNRRYAVHQFVNWLSQELKPFADLYHIEINGLAMLLNEIAKNTADHAESDALFGMDATAVDEQHMRLTFVFGDLGIGIKQHIERHLPPEEEKRREHMSLYEAYRLALKPGYTSNHCSSVNKGYGMSVIMDCASDLKVHLSIFDASSRGLLSSFDRSENPSHAAVRRIFNSIGHDVRFFYYGEVILDRKCA